MFLTLAKISLFLKQILVTPPSPPICNPNPQVRHPRLHGYRTTLKCVTPLQHRDMISVKLTFSITLPNSGRAPLCPSCATCWRPRPNRNTG